MLYHEQNIGGLPWVIYQQHSVLAAVVEVAAEMDFLAEVHVAATAALWSSFSFSAVADAETMASVDVVTTAVSGSYFSYAAVVDLEAVAAMAVAAAAAAAEMIAAAANLKFLYNLRNKVIRME